MCLIYVIAQTIAAINEKSIFRHRSANIKNYIIQILYPIYIYPIYI